MHHGGDGKRSLDDEENVRVPPIPSAGLCAGFGDRPRCLCRPRAGELGWRPHRDHVLVVPAGHPGRCRRVQRHPHRHPGRPRHDPVRGGRDQRQAHQRHPRRQRPRRRHRRLRLAPELRDRRGIHGPDRSHRRRVPLEARATGVGPGHVRRARVRRADRHRAADPVLPARPVRTARHRGAADVGGVRAGRPGPEGRGSRHTALDVLLEQRTAPRRPLHAGGQPGGSRQRAGTGASTSPTPARCAWPSSGSGWSTRTS